MNKKGFTCFIRTCFIRAWLIRSLRTAGILFFIAFAFACSGDEMVIEEEPERVLPVEGVTVTTGRLVDTIKVSGLVSGVRESVVTSQVQGTIAEVRIGLGERVSRGGVLLKIEDSLARLSMEQAQIQLESARGDLEGVERRFSGGTASRADLTRARGAVKGAEVQYESTLKSYNNHTLRSPITGYVAFKADELEPGNLISAGVRVAGISDTSRLRMTVGLSERELAMIRTGAGVKITMDTCETPMRGQVTAIAAAGDVRTGSFPVVVEWENSCGEVVRSGMSAVAEIETHAAAGGLIVPSQGVLNIAGERAVYVYRDGQAVVRPVATGRVLGNRTIALEGLEEGETVIISGLSRLYDGAPVELTVAGESGSW